MRQTLSLLLSVVNYPNLVQHVEDDSASPEKPCRAVEVDDPPALGVRETRCE